MQECSLEDGIARLYGFVALSADMPVLHASCVYDGAVHQDQLRRKEMH